MSAVPSTRVRGAALAWVALLAPPIAWAAQLLLGYGFQEAGCGRPDADLWGAGLNSLTTTVVVVCGAVALLGGLAGAAAYVAAEDDRGRVRFMALAGIASSFLFLLAIGLTAIAVFPLDACDAG
jgi:hypothetical protein